MLELILDRESHNGRHPRQLGPWHWECEARGDNAHYCYYFHFSLHTALAGEATVDIGPDAALHPDGLHSFRAHVPEAVWLSRGATHSVEWQRHPVEREAPHDRIRVRVWLDSGETVSISRMRPYPLSQVTARLAQLAAQPGARRVSLGQSVEGREIPALEVGEGPGSVLLLAGQHPAEFGGTQAVLGAAEYLLSRVPEATVLRARHTFTLVPVLNPDGNFRGNTGANARGEDLYRAFEGAASGGTPAAPEAAALWAWVRELRPALTLNFHTFTQPSPRGDFPWEGLYTPPDEAFADAGARERQRLLDDLLAWETEGLSQHGTFSRHVPGALEYQLAGLGVPSVFYEVQDAVGPFRQARTGVRVLQTALRAWES